MGHNGNRILMAILTGVTLIWTVLFFNNHGHIFFHKQEAGKDYMVIGAGTEGPVTVAEVAAPICELLADADASVGATIAKANCAACHQFDNEVNGTGPHLVGVVGRDVGSVAGFSYSSAMGSFGGQWGEAELNEFLYKPSEYMPGTKMNFGGWDNNKIKLRANVVAYLYENSGIALPQCPVAEEMPALRPKRPS